MKGAPSVGEIRILTRKLQVEPDPAALFFKLAPEDQPVALLQTADASGLCSERSILMSRMALRFLCRQRSVEIEALTDAGDSALEWLESQWSGCQRQGRRLLKDYPEAVQRGRDEDRLKAPSPIDALRLFAESWTLLEEPSQPSFLTAGVFAFDLIDVYEPIANTQADPLRWPDIEFYAPEDMIVIDHRHATTRVFSYVYGGSKALTQGHDAVRRLEMLSQCVEGFRAEGSLAESEQPWQWRPAQEAEIDVDISDEAYCQAVQHLKEHILAGDVYQIVLSRSFRSPCPRPRWAYEALRQSNPSPYMFYLQASQGVLFGASPETALKVTDDPSQPGAKRLWIHPIAGTRKRGRDANGEIDAEADARLELELRLDKKECAEHVMLVDLARNDVARVSQPGSRVVEALLKVERYSQVMHLVSSVSGRLRESMDALTAYVATMNMGTLTGAPKIRAAQLLRQYELNKRGPYGGAVGILSPAGDMDTCIVIRSALVRDGEAIVQAGAGVVHDSEPHLEAEETRRKAAALLKALAIEGRE